MMKQFDVVVIGAGAAGLMCAAQAGYRGRSVLVLDNAKKPGRKILISGGGRCNFTNHQAGPHAFLSANPHFCKSALARYTQQDFIDLVDRHGLSYHEKTLGQLFCDESAKEIVDILLTECDWAGVTLQFQTEILTVSKTDDGFVLTTSQGEISCHSLVVATGGLSMPKLGATPYGFKLAEQFGLKVLPTRAGLVPFTLHQAEKEAFADLAGVSLPVAVTAEDGTCFKEAMLFTHRGLSGPAILQISSFWLAGEKIHINLLPELDIAATLREWAQAHPAQELKTVLGRELPKRFVDKLVELGQLVSKPMRQYNERELEAVATLLGDWQILPNGTEGYRTAEVTLGGVDTNELSSKTMEARKVSGLYFIGEVVDVTGWLGGYNFQWAWSSGWVAGQYC
ncbi:aminoacetone oxidase family FAD-binding enzyme [Aeromonas hydrophila]|nr:aminoacetone oxidase family FAD-binding enzyme [Aeromonas hydrophila]MBQ4712875.1 aminoacetone oxidase family FAD-binding enzyme [Aeromonas hydrophila]MBW3825988.1 aminoacetone oxidase family FAD-binding enzyme [Aeromonas hydrophila]MBW5271102.1 aminoacetone oxidase family FAD-binding enzyme [Aeromonas hydrophila]QSR49831.1 NAD(P)/FAD-dependent oxidoreductase [Aeromonas hydrophila]